MNFPELFYSKLVTNAKSKKRSICKTLIQFSQRISVSKKKLFSTGCNINIRLNNSCHYYYYGAGVCITKRVTGIFSRGLDRCQMGFDCYLLFNSIFLLINISLIFKLVIERYIDIVTIFVCTKCNGNEERVENELTKGQILFDTLKKRLGVFKILMDNQLNTVLFMVDWKTRIRLVPIRCLASCSRANSIAISSNSNKYSYQYGNMDDSKVEDILSFIASYSRSSDGHSKKKDRPLGLQETLLARIPPSSSSVSVAK